MGGAIWEAIARELCSDMCDGRYPPGTKLPTEAELAARFSVNRHTVRRALAELSERGMVYSRRGSGTYVETAPVEYPIGRQVSFRRNLTAAGQAPGRRILVIETRICRADEAAALQIGESDQVHVSEGVALADGHPIAVYSSIFPAKRFPKLPEQLRALGSVTAALRAVGVAEFTRASTRLSAHAATATQARHLRIPEGEPLLRSVALNLCPEGIPVEFGTTFFAGDRVSLTVEAV